MVSYRTITTLDPHYAREKELRERVLRRPLGLSLSSEDLSGEDRQDHLVAVDGAGRVAGCILISYTAGGARFRQLAVDEAHRGKGIGKELLRRAEEAAALRGASFVMLHARTTARGFFEKQGYAAVSEVFTEVTIPHVRMEKRVERRGDGMTGTDAGRLLDEAIEAHGGTTLWDGLQAVEAEISARGFLFTAKGRPVLRRVRMRADVRTPRFTFFDHPRPGLTAELIGNDEVRILDGSGAVVERRERPREAFRGLRRTFRWDELDLVYFAGYATWNYLTTPFLLSWPGVALETLPPVQGPEGRLSRLRAAFPPDIPTHSRTQTFYFDDERLLRRLDYTAEVVGGWAHAAHLCGGYRTFGGLKVPTQRRVLPLLFGRGPLPGPLLVEIDVHDARPVPR